MESPEPKFARGIGPLPYLLGGLAIALSVAVALYLAYWQSLHELEEKTEIVAGEILGRSHAISAQIDAAIKALETRADPNPCSEENIQVMRRLGLGSRYLQAVGYVRDNKLVCSSYGHHGEGVSVGAADYRSRLGYMIRGSVQLTIAGAEVFLISSHQKTGYSAIALPDVAIDFRTSQPSIALGLVGIQSGRTILHRGPVQPEWFARVGEMSGVVHARVDGNLVVLRKSDLYDYAAYAVVSLDQKNDEWLRYSLILVPLSVISGVVLALLIVLLAKRRMALPNLLLQALRRDELFLLYQPIVDLRTGQWVAAEALVRWRRPDGSLIGPDVFIPLAEQSDLIKQVSARVIELALRDSVELMKVAPAFRISVNLSSRDLSDGELVQRFQHAIDQAGLQPGHFVVEVTERVLVQMDDVSRNIQALRTAGVKVAIDDFGTGYSGLSYLTALELDYLKIDKLFVDTIGTDAVTSQVVAHIIEIAKSLRLQMVAEGVETMAQADYLRAQGVHLAQGWLYSRAIPMKVLLTHLGADQRQAGALQGG